jgi:acyl carrier protein
MSAASTAQEQEILAGVTSFIKQNFLFWSDEISLAYDSSLMEGGIIDSTGILQLVSFLESQFGIKIEDHEFIPENLDSLRNITDYVLRKTNGSK